MKIHNKIGMFLTMVAVGCATHAVRAADGAATLPVSDASQEIASGPFKADWESLKQYKVPEWFRDAKFGIWAHWTAQCVPEEGDWYARNMYIQGNGQYNYHVTHYGHPSKFGFKDIDYLWKAENWEPERLIQLYKRAGAKYFVALANHHDNFDCWNSKYQPWNSVAIGPHKDIVGRWAQAARASGLRFGVTVHAARTWDWFDVAQGSDKTGPLADVPYDGTLTKADGKGQWWDGLDPQDLYAQNHKPGERPSEAYINKFFLRVKDLLDSYHPDLLYFDDSVLPFNGISDVGLKIAAHHYNQSARLHGGVNEAVMNTKNLNQEQRKALVWDIERGKSDRIEPFVWQTDTCIGDWHYNRHIPEHHSYKTADLVVHMLVDIVSKNGNLLLNIPVRGDGTIDDQEVQFLQDMAPWMDVNSEAIFGTRPWKVSGEGTPAATRAGNFNEGRAEHYTAQDFRFTTKGNTLYAIAMAWPEDGKLTLKTLATNASGIKGKIKSVQLLGSAAKLHWTLDGNGLAISLPAKKPCNYAYALKITGLDLAASEPVPAVATVSHVVRAAPDGSFVLDADHADLHGTLQTEARGGASNIGYWDNPGDTASWTLNVPQPGVYNVVLRYATQFADSAFTVNVGGQQLAGTVTNTGSWDTFKSIDLGRIEIKQAGQQVLTVRPRDAATWHAINLASLKLQKTG